ncbi:GntR family transcriptional regulator [Paenibacillus sp. MMS20-IR301]|uniref:GntR family transcriptional regulator n=1 Tax=Paenibacillus sp. MMS20-IR301 TaxID=2895946 RepID=UPI0028E26B93|nr:GntR family transcriptional regulator [Paenibacillus sp. MMS20-IR301]WNS44698.1 GntR family transcriptional regulator [Paenibacillus sp. MMS20-IR301]
MHLSVSLTSGEPIYSQVKEQIKNQILAGQLREGELLPSIRNLAQSLKISVITTKRAYDDLEQEGLVTSVSGKGTFVAGNNIESIREIKYRALEDQLRTAIAEGRNMGLTRTDFMNLVTILFGEELEP